MSRRRDLIDGATGRSLHVYGQHWVLHRENGYVISPFEIPDRNAMAGHLALGDDIFVHVAARNHKAYTAVVIDEAEAIVLIAELEAAIDHGRRLCAKQRRAKSASKARGEKKKSGIVPVPPASTTRIVEKPTSGGRRAPERQGQMQSKI
jgi:hypothetical protein